MSFRGLTGRARPRGGLAVKFASPASEIRSFERVKFIYDE